MEKGHIHIGLMTALITFLSLVPAMALWRIATAHLLQKNSSFGKAMAFIF